MPQYSLLVMTVCVSFWLLRALLFLEGFPEAPGGLALEIVGVSDALPQQCTQSALKAKCTNVSHTSHTVQSWATVLIPKHCEPQLFP